MPPLLAGGFRKADAGCKGNRPTPVSGRAPVQQPQMDATTDVRPRLAAEVDCTLMYIAELPEEQILELCRVI